MKAIKKDGQIRFLSSFRSFNNELGFKYATDKQLYDWGFREVITPQLTIYQKLGTIYFEEYIMDASGNTTGDYFTYPVIDFTQEEIDAYDQNILDNDNSAMLEDKYEADGKREYKRIKNRIRRARDSEVISLDQLNLIRKFLRPALLPLITGDWDIAKENLDSLTEPADVKLLAILNIVKNILDTYIIDNNIQ